MDASGSHDANRAYYDAFSQRYEAKRGRNDPGGYHDLLDELEADLVARYGTGKDVLEVGCGTGLVLSRIARFARHAEGVDLSPGMLSLARERGLTVREGSATALPFPNESFDVTCSFKVLAHVVEIERALAEMARVTRRGGVVLAELYNPLSLRGVVKRWGPRGAIAEGADEGQVYTRFDPPWRARRYAPVGTRFEDARGVRILLPAAAAMNSLLGRRVFRRAEHALCDSMLKHLAGFYIAVYRKA